MDKKMALAILTYAKDGMSITPEYSIKPVSFEFSAVQSNSCFIDTLLELEHDKYLYACYIPQAFKNGGVHGDVVQCTGEDRICLGIPTYQGYILADKLKSEVPEDSRLNLQEVIHRRVIGTPNWGI